MTAPTSPPMATLAVVATGHIRIGTNVINNDFHHPVLLARGVATLALLSDGRFEPGWVRAT